MGRGVLTLTGSNTYSGTTTVLANTLRADDGAGLPSGSLLVFDGQNGVLETSGTFTRPADGTATSGNKVRWANGNDPKGGGFAARGGPLTVNLGGAAEPVVLPWYTGAGAGARISGVLRFGSATADSRVVFRNPIDLNNVERIVGVTLGVGPEGGVAELAGNITDAWVVTHNAMLRKRGFGKLILSGTNSYPGVTIVQDGPMLINGDHSSATGGVSVSAIAMFGGTGTVGGRVTVNGGVLSAGDTNTVGTLALANLTLGAGSTVQVDGADGAFDRVALSGVLTAGTNVTVRLNMADALPDNVVVATAAGGIDGLENLGTWRLEGGGRYSRIVWRPSAQALVVSSSSPGTRMLVR
jgi:autotransporter-associated beta strand protein